jgi:hypothetical protein
VRRSGHPTTRFSFTAPGDNDSAAYARGDGQGEQAVGKRIRLTAWLKCEDVAGQAGLVIFVEGANFTQLADEGQKNHRPLRGTMEWQHYTATCDVPAGAQAIFTGIGMRGNGRIWMDDVRVEVVDATPAAK